MGFNKKESEPFFLYNVADRFRFRIALLGWYTYGDLNPIWIIYSILRIAGSQTFVSVWPRNFTWRQRSESDLAQALAFCPTVPSRHLIQRWVITKGAVWYSPESNLTTSGRDLNRHRVFGNDIFEIITTFTRDFDFDTLRSLLWQC